MTGIGIIGAGGIATHHLRAIARHRGAKAVCLADVHLDRARALAEHYGVAEVTDDPSDILRDDRIDAIILALPTHLHGEWLLRCAKAGKHILTEKPLCRTTAEARRVLRACARAGVRVAVGYQRRFSPARVKVRALVQSGALGGPVTWHISSFGPRKDYGRGPGNWTWDRERGGGMVMDGSIHDFDFACWVLGPPKGLFARTRCLSDAVTAPTEAHALIDFANGHRLVYDAAWTEGDFGKSAEPSRIVGPKGIILLNSDTRFTWRHAPGKERVMEWDINTMRPADMGVSWLFYRQLDAFLRGAPNPSLASGDEALASLWIAEQIVAADWYGRRARCPL